MLLELIIFCLSLGLGFLFRFTFLVVSLLCKKINNKAATITLEIIAAGVFVFLFGVILFFFNNGLIAFYAIFAFIKGFILACLIK